MAGIKLGEFRGVRPRMSARLLDPREGQRAINVRLGSGELRPLRGFTQFANWAKAGAITSMYPYDHPTLGRLWLHWVDDVDVAAGPNVNDENQRIYYTGDGLPKMTFDDLVAVGEGDIDDPAPGQFPRDWRYLGIPAPPALDRDDLQFTAPNLGGTLTNFTGPVEFESSDPQSAWDALLYTPASFVWLSLFWDRPPPACEITFTPGDEFLVEVLSPTSIRINAFGRDYLTESFAIRIDPGDGFTDAILDAAIGNFYTRPNADGTPDISSVDNQTLPMRSVRPQNGAVITFPADHGLSSGEILRITAISTPPSVNMPALFTGLSGLRSSPQFWKSTTELTWTGEVEYEVTREGVGTASGTVEDRAYVYTYVSDLGEEGPPSDPTDAVTVTTSGGVLLTGFAVPDLPKRVISHIRLYRADTNDTSAEYRFVTEIAIADISGYTPPEPGDPVELGGVLSYSPDQPVVALSTVAPAATTTTQLSYPTAFLTTAATTVALSARLQDDDNLFGSVTPVVWVAPSWTLQFQVSTDGTLWADVGLPKTATIPVVTYNDGSEYGAVFILDATLTDSYDASGATIGDPLYFRAVVTYNDGRTRSPTLSLFTASEPVVGPPLGFDPTPDYSYLDTLLSYQLGEVLPSDTWFPPPDTMHSLVTMPNGMLAGAYGNTVAFCEPYRPHAWPPEYEQSIDYTIVGLGVFGNSLLVCTTGTPYVMTGTHPRNVSMRRIEVNQACVSKNSIANVGVGVLYATPDGLGFASQQGFKLITDEHFDRDTWQALNPATMVGFSHDERYICFFTPPVGGTEGAFVFDPMRPDTGLSFVSSTGIRGGFNDLLSDTLFLTNGAARLSWDTGSAMTYTWRSKAVGMPYAINPAASRVLASAYPITFRLYGDGVLRHERAVANREAFRLPGGYLANEFEVELVGVGDLRNVWVGETMREVLEG